MKREKPIPTPWRLRIRELRIQIVPVLVFVFVAGVVTWIWSRHVTPPLLVGQVEPVRAEVVSAQAGTLGRLNVGLYDSVRAGQEVAVVIRADPRLVEANLAVIRAELNLARAQLDDPMIQAQRARIDLERLRLELLEQRTQLAVAKVRLQFAEAELNRLSELIRTKPEIVSQSAYDQARTERDALVEEIARREETVKQLQQALTDLAAMTASANEERLPQESMLRRVQAILDLQEQRLRLAEAELSPISLTAPIDGVVSAVYRRAGENVIAGEPIVVISATNATRIIAYALPPYADDIAVGAEVEVIRRSPRRESGVGQVLYVGPVMEPVPPTLFTPLGASSLGLTGRPVNLTGQVLEVGIPVVVSLPPELPLRPGELVDLRYRGAAGRWSWTMPASPNS